MSTEFLSLEVGNVFQVEKELPQYHLLEGAQLLVFDITDKSVTLIPTDGDSRTKLNNLSNSTELVIDSNSFENNINNNLALV